MTILVTKKCLECGKKMLRHPNAFRCIKCAHIKERESLKRSMSKNGAKAMQLVKKAIRNGILSPIGYRTKCVDCGRRASCYDHRDYRKPLVVEPVCHSCNKVRGPALGR